MRPFLITILGVVAVYGYLPIKPGSTLHDGSKAPDSPQRDAAASEKARKLALSWSSGAYASYCVTSPRAVRRCVTTTVLVLLLYAPFDFAARSQSNTLQDA